MSTRPVSRRGRPRSEAARDAVFRAVSELAAESDPAAMTIEAIARRAGVSKDTIYRWWRSRTEIVLDTLTARGDQTIALPDTGSLRDDLRAFLRDTAASADATTQSLLRTIAAEAARDQATAAQIRDGFIAARREALRTLLQRAADRGQVAEPRVELLIDLIYGSLWYRVIFGVGRLDEPWADAIADVATR